MSLEQVQIFHNGERRIVYVRDLPLSARVCFTVWGCKELEPGKTKRKKRRAKGEHELKAVVVGGVSMSVYDHRRVLRSGMLQLRLWSGRSGERHTACVDNTSKKSHLSSYGVATLHLKLDDFPRSVRYALPPRIPRGTYKIPSKNDRPTRRLPKHVREDVMRETMKLVNSFNPLMHELTYEQMARIWQARFDLATHAQHLPIVLRSVNWQDPNAAQEAYDLLSIWDPLSPLQSLELLGYRYGDYRVRQYAVRRLEEFTDDELGQFILQLVQALKVEPFHRSPLAFFLVRRALSSPELVGQTLFWQLRSEMHTPRVAERFGVLLRSYLVQATHHRNALSRQNDVQNMLKAVADDVVRASLKMSGIPLQEYCRERLAVTNKM
jgi:phosphatidylinositol-4,5-bisphosphate 3-kinase